MVEVRVGNLNHPLAHKYVVILINKFTSDLMCHFQQNAAGNYEQYRKDPHRAYGVTVELNAQCKCSCSTDTGPYCIGSTHGNITLGEIKKITAVVRLHALVMCIQTS